MHYIILDLEWDSVFVPLHKRFVNQILQIGAVKLNESFQIEDTLEITVKSSVSKRVTGRFKELTGITKEKMLAGAPFAEAVERYNSWSGRDTVTMTWSDTDLHTILENETYLLPDGQRFYIEKYVDLQKFVQGEMRLEGYDSKNQISLAGAAEAFGISADPYELHTARDDSLVCAELLKKCYQKERFSALVRDTADGEFYKRLRFKSHPISSLKDEDINKAEMEFSCPACGKKLKRCSKWRYRNRWFSAFFRCSACDRKFNGRISFIKTYDDVKVRKIIRPAKPETEKSSNEMQSVPEKV